MKSIVKNLLAQRMDRQYEKLCREREIRYPDWIKEMNRASMKTASVDEAVLLTGTEGEWTKEAGKVFASFFL